jgi:hypothetical protein
MPANIYRWLLGPAGFVTALLVWCAAAGPAPPGGLAAGLLVAAPSQAPASPTAVPPRGWPAAANAGIANARTDLARRLNVDPVSITVVSVTSQEWPSSAMGCPLPRQNYLPVVTPGYEIILAAGGARYTYHASLRGAVVACPASTAPPPPAGVRYFPETGHSVQGRFLAYWEQHGGLAQHGYPLTDELQETSAAGGKTYTVQYFERDVFELHPENQPPYDVLLSRLGAARWAARYPTPPANQRANTDNPRRFPETGHTAGGRFRAYWEQHGGLAQQGYPLSEEFPEQSDLDGRTYTVQYFERAVFEYHPENPPPYDVLLTQLGKFHLAISRAQAVAAGLKSPPRVYAVGPGDIALWPPDTGSTVTHYSTCGIQPLAWALADPCAQPMTLTTALAGAGDGLDVTFLATWANGARTHRWQLHVGADRQAVFVQESGDRLPILPQ